VTELFQSINKILWGLFMPVLLIGIHCYYTIHLKGVQKHIIKALRLSVSSGTASDGDLSSFASLSATLAATIGTGNIIGISTAVALGGPGAILWCWLTGVLGMATTYAECYLGILFRKKTGDGSYIGGPMAALEHGLNKKWLALVYCFFTLTASFCVGCSTQARAVTETAKTLWGLPEYAVGLAVALTVGFVIVGGIKSIGKICSGLVPAMGFFYMLGCIIILLINRKYLFPAAGCIISSAFNASELPAAFAGGVIGSAVKSAIRYGIARGLFSNEAGIGTAAIAAASAKTPSPSRQALVSMSATFWDTVVMCAITGLVIVTCLVKDPFMAKGYSFSELTTASFRTIPFGEHALGISIIAFATATLIGWSYFGEKAAEYLLGKSITSTYRICYIVMIFIGSIMSMELIWEMTDVINACMAFPNLFCLIMLRRSIKPYDG
jgi:AGCS family alanine or glycine:cation symporter